MATHTNGSAWSVTDAEIERLCYMKSARTIAIHKGVSVERVEAVWAAMPKERRRHLSERALPDSVPIGLGEYDVRRSEATYGSASLRDAILRMFEKHERKNDLQPGEGMIVQLFGRNTLNLLRQRKQAA